MCLSPEGGLYLFESTGPLNSGFNITTWGHKPDWSKTNFGVMFYVSDPRVDLANELFRYSIEFVAMFWFFEVSKFSTCEKYKVMFEQILNVLARSFIGSEALKHHSKKVFLFDRIYICENDSSPYVCTCLSKNIWNSRVQGLYGKGVCQCAIWTFPIFSKRFLEYSQK